MQNLKQKKEYLVHEIYCKYHYFRWVEDTHTSIAEIPAQLQVIYYRYGYIAELPASSNSDIEVKQQIAELKQIRKKLKKYYRKGEKEHEIFNTIFRV